MPLPFASKPDRTDLNHLPVVGLVGEIPLAEALGFRFRFRRLDAATPPAGADVLLVRAEAVDDAALAALHAPVLAGVPLVVLADADTADAAGALMGLTVVGFLEPSCRAEDLEGAIAGALRARRGGVADTRAPFDPRLERLREEAERIAAAIRAMAAEREAEAPRPVDAPRIRAHIKARRLRETFFPQGLFADPAWDILLDLAAARREGRAVSVSSLCIAAAVPTTTALRWIKHMVDDGLLVRRADQEDARRAFIELAPSTAETLDRCLEACFNLPGL